MNTICNLLLVLLFIFPNQQKSEPLFQGIYTETGYGKDENNQPLNSGFSQSYYVKIYGNKLIVSTVEFGTGKNINLTYLYKGKDNEGYRIYTKDQMNTYYVDDTYDLTKVLSMPVYGYGNNVWRSTYWEVVKGEKYQYYNQKHKEDGSSYESQYQKYQMPEYYQIFDY